jgi:foldase protein PrsA
MSKDKLLWGVIAVLAVISAILAWLLFSAQQLPSTNEPNNEQRVVAQAGNVVLMEDEFLEGLRATYEDEYIQQWLERVVVRLEAQKLAIIVSQAEIEDELQRMQVGYDSEAEFYKVMQEQLGLSNQDVRDDIVHRLALEEIAIFDIEVSESDIERYIADNPEEFAPRLEVRYSQIISASEADSEQVLEQLREGVDFALLAQDVSVDTSTASSGGDVGWVREDDPFIVPEATAALQKLKLGEISLPILMADDRWVIVMLTGKRVVNPMDDSRLREMLRKELALSQAPSLFDVVEGLLARYDAVDFVGND